MGTYNGSDKRLAYLFEHGGGGGGNANIWTGTQEELEEVFDSLEDGTQINITNDEQESIDGGDVYSDAEQCIGLWRDGKPLYQKTLSAGALPNNGSKFISTGYLTNEIRVVEITGIATNTTQNTSLVLPRAWLAVDNTRYFIDLICTANNGYASVRIYDAFDYSAYNETYITVKYTKTADAPLDVTIGKPTVYVASSDCYSSAEKEVGCWKDGKPLYMVTVTATSNVSVNDSTWTDISAAMSPVVSNVEYIVDSIIHGQSPNSYLTLRFNASNEKICCAAKTSGTWATGTVVTFFYTKTTDTAGSGSYAPANGKAVHYSLEEQVIGTWVDGSTLYRKSFITTQNLTVSNNQWTSTGFTITNGGVAVRAFMIRNTDTGQTFPVIAYIDNGSLKIEVCWSSQLAFPTGSIITLEYTKSA